MSQIGYSTFLPLGIRKTMNTNSKDEKYGEKDNEIKLDLMSFYRSTCKSWRCDHGNNFRSKRKCHWSQ